MSKRSDSLYIRDIIEAIEAIFSYTQGIAFDDFKLDRMRYSAVIREFELIGEAVGNLADTVKETFEKCPHAVIPAKAGIQKALKKLDSCFRRNDDLPSFGRNSKVSTGTASSRLMNVCR